VYKRLVACLKLVAMHLLSWKQSTHHLTLTHASSPPSSTINPQKQSFFFPYPNIYQAWRAAAAAVTSDVDAVVSAEAVETEEATVVVAVAADAGVVGTRTRRRAGPP
jgi:hypothetical protein